MTKRSIATAIAIACALPLQATSFSSSQLRPASRSISALDHSNSSFDEQTHYETDNQPSSRRAALSKILQTSTAAATATLTLTAPQSAHASSSPLLSDLETSYTKLQQLPDLLQSSQWDAARTVLKTPPVNSLWNLGESSNTIVKLAKETGEFDLLEMKDELAISLQMCDQYSYDNVFIYYQPGECCSDCVDFCVPMRCFD